MSISQAIAGVGTRFQWWDGLQWLDIAEIQSIDGPGMNKENIEVTTLNTQGGYDEFITGFIDGGEVTLEMNFTRNNYDFITNGFEREEFTNYRILLMDESGTSLEFIGFISDVDLIVEADDRVEADVTLHLTGETWLDKSQWENYWVKSGLFEFLWVGEVQGNFLIDRLHGYRIEVTGKDFTGAFIPYGSFATFRMGNVPDLIQADEADHFWYDIAGDGLQKTFTELIDEDPTRTVVRYSEVEPYDITAIGLLKEGVTLTEEQMNLLHHDFLLWVFWSGVFNDFGYVKDNKILP
ncbi:MAG: phage tail tube protein [Desulfomonilia bacterium]